MSLCGGISMLSKGMSWLLSSGPSEYSEGEEYADDRDDIDDTVTGKLVRGAGAAIRG